MDMIYIEDTSTYLGGVGGLWAVLMLEISGYWESESLSLPDHLSVETLAFTAPSKSNIYIFF